MVIQTGRFAKHRSFHIRVHQGVSLAELLIVTSLAILLSFGIFIGIKHQVDVANDAKRKSDLFRITQALESYYNDHNCYFSDTQWRSATCGVKASFLPDMNMGFPCDPVTLQKYAYLQTNADGSICEGECGACKGYRLLTSLADWSDPDIAGSGCSVKDGCGYTDPSGRLLNYGKAVGAAVMAPTPIERATPTGLAGTSNITPTPKVDPPITRSVLVLDFNPQGTSQGKTIRQQNQWYDPQTLESQFISEIASASGGYLKYVISKRYTDINEFPHFEDGFSYNAETYADTLSGKVSPHNPDTLIDYEKIVSDYGVCKFVNNGTIQELWIWGGPWFGFLPTAIAGPSSYYIGEPPVMMADCGKPLLIFGFRYDQDVEAMLSTYASHAETVLSYVFNEYQGSDMPAQTDWGKFSRVDIWTPGQATCGLASHAPNAINDNDYTNVRVIQDTCDTWSTYPQLGTGTTIMNCKTWGCTELGFDRWWLTRIPHRPDKSGAYFNNWWKYITLNE